MRLPVTRRQDYFDLIVESFAPDSPSGHHGTVHLRPISGQRVPTHVFVAGSKRMSDTDLYRVGTKFKVSACWVQKEPLSVLHLYSNPRDGFAVLSAREVKEFLAKKRGKS